MWGNTPSSMPTMKTTGNSRPLALCKVIKVTAPPSSSSSSVSLTRLTDSRNSSTCRIPSGGSP